ncbi:MAG: ABC transporter ATP-binding protein [Bacteroidota bacterium]
MYCIETAHLFHKFSDNEIALNDINLQIPERSIYGFLGPNGAGKTTTLKLILGLLKKQKGEILIFGKQLEKNRIDILQNIGSLIESPSLYGHLTAIENLILLQKIYRCPKERIQKVLDLVGLSNTGNKKTSQFSLGMKQRLSIAIALLHNPSLLILDEPTNGLDPNGMIEIRELLIKLNQEQGITIIISSHLLAEIEKLVNHVGVINKGILLFQGTLEELKSKQKETRHIIFETNNMEKTLEIFSANDLKGNIEDGKIILPSIPKKMINKLANQLIENDIEVYEISIVRNDLETIFMNLISN